MASDTKVLELKKEYFKKELQMKVMGFVLWYFGMNIIKLPEVIIINQTKYIKIILKHFKMVDAKKCSKPLAASNDFKL